MDRHYTPEEMARLLVAAIPKRPKTLADFAAGEGALLAAARKRWPKASFVATDIDKVAVRKLAGLSKTKAEKCNFLSRAAHDQCELLNKRKGSLDVIVLNPPFSCRGSKHRYVCFFNEQVKCSTAMAFVLNAVPYLGEDGVLAAILPASCMTSDKDSKARTAIASRYQLEWKRPKCDDEFAGCSVSVVFALIKPGRGERRVPRRALTVVGKERLRAELFRGIIPVDEALALKAKVGLPFIHTTALRASKVVQLYNIAAGRSLISGPAIFFPRVGRFNPQKVCLKLSNDTVAVSDCVFSLQTSSLSGLVKLHKRLQHCASYLELAYDGSCAKYTTIERITAVLHNLNIAAVRKIVQAEVTGEEPLKAASISRRRA